jgi:hypothetical protein
VTTDCEENAQIVFLPQIETTDCEENAQIVFLPQIETTYCEENAQIVFLLQIETIDTKKKMQRLSTKSLYSKKFKYFGRCKDSTCNI